MKKFAVLCVLILACDKPAPPPPTPKPVPVAIKAPASLPASLPAAPVTVEAGPRVLALTGKVLIDGKVAVVGSPITPTSVVETGDASTARITLIPHSVIAIRPNSKFTIGTSERKKWSVQLVLGAVWSFLPKGASYEVVTNNAVAGVRGTILYVSEMGDKKSGVCACDGEVELTVGKKKETVKSKFEHIGSVIGGDGTHAKVMLRKKSPDKPPGHEDHAEAIALEKLRETIDK